MIGSAAIDKVLNTVGSWYDIRIGSVSYNDYGDGNIVWTNTSGIGFVEITDESYEKVRAGILKPGDAVGYFKMEVEELQAGSEVEIKHQGQWFVMDSDPTVPMISGNQLIKTVELKKKVE